MKQEITLANKRLVALISELKAMPGRFLFRYIGSDGATYRIRAADINMYLQECAPIICSSKDYRTWYAGLWAFRLLAKREARDDQGMRRKYIVEVLDAVSARLGNTRTVCKQYYVPDCLLAAYEDGKLLPYFPTGKRSSLREMEGRLLDFLKKQVKLGDIPAMGGRIAI